MHRITQHHIDHDAFVALVAGPIAFVALGVGAILLKDAPVAHAAHSALTGR